MKVRIQGEINIRLSLFQEIEVFYCVLFPITVLLYFMLPHSLSMCLLNDCLVCQQVRCLQILEDNRNCAFMIILNFLSVNV